MGWYHPGGTASAVMLSVVVVALLLASWVAVPCAALSCALSNNTLASVALEGVSALQPTVAQRVKIGVQPIVITVIYLSFDAPTAGDVMEAQIHEDGADTPGVLVSSQYISQVITDVGPTYKFTFINGSALQANTAYWIVFTGTITEWKTGSNLNVTSSINVDAGFGYTWAANIPQDQVQNYAWTMKPAGLFILNFTILGCAVDLALPSPTPTPTISSTPQPSASTTPVVILTPTPNSGTPLPITSTTPPPSSTPQASASETPVQVPTQMPVPSSTPQASASTTPPPSSTPQASASTTPVVPTPQASASATPVVLTPITANVTSSFDSTQTALNLTAPATSTNGTSGVTQPGVTVVSQFSEVRVGNRTLPPPAIQELTVSNDTSTNATTYTYTSQLENTTNVEQAFTFFNQKTSGDFSGLTFDISASTVKWSIRLMASSTNSTAAAAASEGGLTLRYQLTGLMMAGNSNTSSGGGAVASRGQVVVQRETPRANMTTYLVPLFTTSNTSTTTRTTAAKVELFDVALIDGTHFVPINHSIVRTSVDDEEASYVVELVLPGFNESLYYDPSIGLGVLLGRNRDDGGVGSSDSNVGLIVGVAVAVPVAVALVLVVIGAALVVRWRQRRRMAHHPRSGNINYGPEDHDL